VLPDLAAVDAKVEQTELRFVMALPPVAESEDAWLSHSAR
jgi:hypothetical protein